MKERLQRIFIKGGILSPGELKQIIRMTQSLGLTSIKFGSRQDILFPYKESNRNVIDQYPNLNISDVSKNDNTQNIVCSYVSADIFPSTYWLNGTTYLYILEQFKYNPKLKINITDPKQQITPLFTGNINFIASEHEDYWHLKLRFPNREKPINYPVLVYSWDIANVAKGIEEYYQKSTNLTELFQWINQKYVTNNRTAEKELEIPFQPFPYYEGMNKMGVNEYWLGLYWRNNEYDLNFLNNFCDFCLDSRIGKISITPWKSFIVKGIDVKYKLKLERFIGRQGINVRHSSLELNWHLPVDDKDALELKRFIVRNFDQNDISTYGLTFGVTYRYSNDTYFTSTVIETNERPQIVRDFEIRPTYNVLYCKNFNPNTQQYIIYAQDVDRMELPSLLMELSKLYFDNLGRNEKLEYPKMKETQSKKIDRMVYQCQYCQTIYEMKYGDMQSDIKKNTAFEDVPSTYKCPVCEASKEHYRLVRI